jgi:hypothetical protein
VLAGSGCSGDRKQDLDPAQRFDAFPLYWVGERFEKLDLKTIDGLDGVTEFVTFIYGDCKLSGGDEPSCAPPLEIQVAPLCSDVDAAARTQTARRTLIRGAPVGRALDGAPVLLTRRAAVKVYRGQGSDPGIPTRALRALRSINEVEPVIDSTGGIPPPARGILEGTQACSS